MVQQIIVGSSALQHWEINIGREPKDVDIISNQDVKEGDVLINKELFEILLKYIGSADITTKAVKQLPAKCGLPEKLTKYGLVLQTVEDTEQEIKEQQQQQEGN